LIFLGFKKFALVARMIPVVSLISTPQASAKTVVTYAAGSWDKVGYTESIYLHNQQIESTQTISSGGGNVQIRPSGISGTNTYVVWLYELDGDKINKQLIGKKYGYGTDPLTWDVSNFVDGTNNKAEIFAHIGYAKVEQSGYFTFYD